jgi:hypothetical protein
MMNQSLSYARTQADGYDNIAPSPLQGQQAWQFAQSDNFLSNEEAAAVMRQQLEPYRAQIEAKLAQIGYPAEHLAKRPDVQDALFSGQKTGEMTVFVTPDLQLHGRLRIVMTDSGPDIRITPTQRQLLIPDVVEGIHLSKGEKQQLIQQGSLPRPFIMADKGEYVPTYLRIDEQTNTLELWRIRPELLPSKLMGIDLTKDQQHQLANGHAVRLSGLLDKQGEPFTATVSLSAAQKGLQFTDISGPATGLKPDSENRQQLALNNEGAKTDITRGQEIATGQITVSNHQRETMKNLLEGKPDQALSTPKQRIP